MFEKVNPCHPDKVADRIAGALVDLAYKKAENPRIAVEVLLGHGICHIIAETSVKLSVEDVEAAVLRIAGDVKVDYAEVPQDEILAGNQAGKIRCGDNGIFKGMPVTEEQKEMTRIAREIYAAYPTDGKYILDGNRLIICQSNARTAELMAKYPQAEVNPLGDWTGGSSVDCGATNRKLGSDMADSVIFNSSAKSPTHISDSLSASNIFILVLSPNTLKSSAKSIILSSSKSNSFMNSPSLNY